MEYIECDKFKFGELRKSGFEENNEWQHGVV